ncbi:G-protein coupled receptor 4, partial [Nibea albiflora]
MEDLHMNNTSQEESFNYSNMTDYSDYENIVIIEHVVTYIIIGVGLPLILVAISTLYCQVRNDHVAPIYVINLLISDLIQFCCFIIWLTPSEDINKGIAFIIYRFSVMASVGFMVCVALERYLVVAWPLWYRFRRTIKTSVVVCVVVWIFPLVYVPTSYFWFDKKVYPTVSAVYLLLPFPLFIFFLGGTLKALSASTVPSDEKRRIVAVLVLVLLIYTLLFMPRIIWSCRLSSTYCMSSLSIFTADCLDAEDDTSDAGVVNSFRCCSFQRYMNNISQDYSFNYNTYDYDDYENAVSAQDVMTYIIISVGLPLTLVAIYGLFCQVRNGQVAPIYVINLLITDIIQLCCMIALEAGLKDQKQSIEIVSCIHEYSLLTSVCFMVFGRRLATVVPLQTNHQDLCGGLCRGLDLYSSLSPHF